jgi:hypothetical protein
MSENTPEDHIETSGERPRIDLDRLYADMDERWMDRLVAAIGDLASISGKLGRRAARGRKAM